MVMPSVSDLRSRIATRISSSGGSIATVSPESKREIRRLSIFDSSFGYVSDVMMICLRCATDKFKIDGLNTTDTNWFAPGSGKGTAQAVSNWVEIPQVLTIATS